MTQQVINNGSAAGDGQGENLFSAFAKVNANFTELYALPSGGSPAGLTNYIQYNVSGAFAASIKYQWNDTTNTMTLGTGLTGGIAYIKAGAPTTGAGNALYLQASNAVGTGAVAGGSVNILGGDGSSSVASGNSNGGGFSLNGGTGYGATPSGGGFFIEGGPTQGNAGFGGYVGIYGGNDNSVIGGSAGTVQCRGGDTVNGHAGSVSFNGGNVDSSGSGTGIPGGINFIAGYDASGFQPDGDIVFFTTKGTATLSGSTGSLTFNGGSFVPPVIILTSGSTAAALEISGNSAGNVALRVNTSATTGAQTATFTATNKPGTATTAPTKWLPINLDGTKYYIPCWT